MGKDVQTETDVIFPDESIVKFDFLVGVFRSKTRPIHTVHELTGSGGIYKHKDFLGINDPGLRFDPTGSDDTCFKLLGYLFKCRRHRSSFLDI
jgi:hypothetical protein